MSLSAHDDVMKDTDEFLKSRASDNWRRFGRKVGLHVGGGGGLLIFRHVEQTLALAGVSLFLLALSRDLQ